MIEVRIAHAEPGWTMTGRCYFCGVRCNRPETVQAVVYEDGEDTHGLACPDCLSLSEAALRAEMRAYAARLEAWATDVRAAAAGPIRRPPADVLDLERRYQVPVVIEAIGPREDR